MIQLQLISRYPVARTTPLCRAFTHHCNFLCGLPAAFLVHCVGRLHLLWYHVLFSFSFFPCLLPHPPVPLQLASNSPPLCRQTSS